MIATIRRRAPAYLAIAAMAPKFFLAYSVWVWMELFVQIITLVVFVAFWQAVYANSDTIAGLNIGQTLNYVLLARIFSPLTYTVGIGLFGRLLREGQMAIELLRPVDFQGQMYVGGLAEVFTSLVLQLPLMLVAVVFFGLNLPSDPIVWFCFLVSGLLGHTALFFFDWTLSCLSFYTTEVWGLIVVRYNLGLFFSGTLLPLVMMPGWLQGIVNSIPLAQALYTPVSILSQIRPLSDVPGILITQLFWLIGLWVISRLVFRTAVKKVTVQGG